LRSLSMTCASSRAVNALPLAVLGFGEGQRPLGCDSRRGSSVYHAPKLLRQGSDAR
jgi:hypothetical protein